MIFRLASLICSSSDLPLFQGAGAGLVERLHRRGRRHSARTGKAGSELGVCAKRQRNESARDYDGNKRWRSLKHSMPLRKWAESNGKRVYSISTERKMLQTGRFWRWSARGAVAAMLLVALRMTSGREAANANDSTTLTTPTPAVKRRPHPIGTPGPLPLPANLTIPKYRQGAAAPFNSGETLVYDASWIGIPAAEAKILIAYNKAHPELWTGQMWITQRASGRPRFTGCAITSAKTSSARPCSRVRSISCSTRTSAATNGV